MRPLVKHPHVAKGVDMMALTQVVDLQVACPTELFPLDWAQKRETQGREHRQLGRLHRSIHVPSPAVHP